MPWTVATSEYSLNTFITEFFLDILYHQSGLKEQVLCWHEDFPLKVLSAWQLCKHVEQRRHGLILLVEAVYHARHASYLSLTPQREWKKGDAPNLHFPHLHRTQIYKTHIYTKPRFTQTQIYTAQIYTHPNLHSPILAYPNLHSSNLHQTEPKFTQNPNL